MGALGIEPRAFRLKVYCSTTKLYTQNKKNILNKNFNYNKV